MTDEITIRYLLPEIVLILGAALIFVAGAFHAPGGRCVWASRVFVLIAAVSLWRSNGVFEDPGMAGQAVFLDQFSAMFRCVSLILAGLFTFGWTSSQDSLEGERVGSALLVFAGCMLVSTAADVGMLFVALEMVSIPTYTLLFLGQRTSGTSESAVKYFFLSILSSAVFLYGLALMFATTGSTALGRAAQAEMLNGEVPGSLASLSIMLILVGIGFKLAAFPGQFYAADVYQGTTHQNAGLLAVAPKIAGIAALLRLMAAWGPSDRHWFLIAVAMMALVTMTYGNVCALWQNHVRRLLAYSSVAHGGYLLIGVAVATLASWSSAWTTAGSAVVLYLFVYSIASLGAFSALASIRMGGRAPTQLDELAGLGRRQPLLAFALAVSMFSLAGIPPLAGFWGKFGLFGGAIGASQIQQAPSGWLLALAIAGALNAAVAAAYYLRIINAVCFRESVSPDVPHSNPSARRVAVVCAFLLILIGCFPQSLMTRFRGAMAAASQSAVRLLPADEKPENAQSAGGQGGQPSDQLAKLP